MPEPPPEGMRVEAKIRYQHAPAGARILPLDGGRVEVRFETPQPAVTPGQLAVFSAIAAGRDVNAGTGGASWPHCRKRTFEPAVESLSRCRDS